MNNNINFARYLRKEATEVEKILWQQLRGHRFYGLKFKRQQPIGHYVVDFVCLSKRVIIELDGSEHAEHVNYDQERDQWLTQQGYKVLRFWNKAVIENKEGVMAEIAKYCGIN